MTDRKGCERSRGSSTNPVFSGVNEDNHDKPVRIVCCRAEIRNWDFPTT